MLHISNVMRRNAARRQRNTPTLAGFVAYVAINHPGDVPLSDHDVKRADMFLSHASRVVLLRAVASRTDTLADLVGEYVESVTAGRVH